MYQDLDSISRALIDETTALVIGNGFDLALNLPTAYRDFYASVENAKKYNSFEDFLQQEKLLFATKKCDFNEDVASRFYAKVRNVNGNYFLDFIHNYHEKFEEWNALETAIKNIVFCFDYMLSTCHIRDGNSFISGDVSKFENKTPFYLVENWKNYKIELLGLESFQGNYPYCKFTLENKFINLNIKEYEKSKMIESFKKEIPALLFSDLKEIEHIFSLYLGAFALFRNKEINSHSGKYDYIITYNYTDSAEKLYETIKTVHVHGKNDVNCDGVNIVIGIDSSDEVQLEMDAFRDFSKFSQRILSKTVERIGDSLLKNVTQIDIFGHSFDEFDKETLRLILLNEKTKTINIYYLDENDERKKVRNLSKIIPEKWHQLYEKKILNFIPAEKFEY